MTPTPSIYARLKEGLSLEALGVNACPKCNDAKTWKPLKDRDGWWCHRCQSGKTLVDAYKEREGITAPRGTPEEAKALEAAWEASPRVPAPPPRPAAQGTPGAFREEVWTGAGSAATGEGAAWLTSRGLDPARVADLDLARTPARGALVVACWSPVGALVQAKTRHLPPKEPPEHGGDPPPKEMAVKGAPLGGSAFACTLARTLACGEAAPSWDRSVVVVEGLPDFLTVASLVADLPHRPAVLGVYEGSWNARDGATWGDAVARWKPARVVVVCHGDAAGEKHARRALEALAGLPVVRGPACDLNDAHRAGEDVLGRLAVAPVDEPPKRLRDRLSPVGDLGWLDIEAPRLPVLLETLDNTDPQPVLPLGILGILAAAGGVGKSMALLDLCVLVASGFCPKVPDGDRGAWLGAYRLRGDGGRVLYLAGEETADELHRRLRRVVAARPELDREPYRQRIADRLWLAPLAGVPSPLVRVQNDQAEPRADLGEVARLLDTSPGFALVVVDTLARFIDGGVETDNNLATKALQHLETLTGGGRRTVLVAHHTGKAARRDGDASASAVRGVAAITDTARWVATLTRREDVGLPDPQTVFELVKANAVRLPPRLVLVQRRGAGGVLQAATGEEREAYAAHLKARKDEERSKSKPKASAKSKDKPEAAPPAKGATWL